MCADDAVEWRDNIGVAVIDCRDLGVDLGLLKARLCVVARRDGLIERCLRGRVSLHQIRLTLVVGFGLFHRRLRTCLRGLGLLQFQLVGFGLDREQRRARLYEAAILVVDRFQYALHPRHKINRLDRRRVARRIEITRDVLLDRQADIHFRRRRLHKIILFATAQGGERQYGESHMRNNDGTQPHAVIHHDACRRTQRLHFHAPVHLGPEGLSTI
jgi:hypothetical protein